MERAAEYGKPLAFHVGADSYENTHPYGLGNLAGRFPEVEFLMVHMGGAALPPLSRAAIEIATRHRNVTIIGSAIPENAVLEAIEQVGAGRVCFGSDTPFFMMHVRLAMYRALVLGGNILRVLGFYRSEGR
nr:amidohydrolase family protein [Rubrobacter taiwanensis]